jgi:glyoxylase-like metal-dependent hydrolase (beta-lactamase superfamily II)
MYDVVPIAEGVNTIPIPFDGGASSINIHLLGPPADTILVDAGHHATAGELIRTLEARGVGPGGVRAIIPTHAHQDHYGGAGALAAWSGARIWAHPAAVSQIEDAWDHYNAWSVVASAPSWEDFLKLQGAPAGVARLLREGDLVAHAGMELKVLHTPGHERGAITLFEPARRIAFVGDLIQGGSDAAGNWLGLFSDAAAQRRSLERLMGLDAAVLCKGHRRARLGAEVREDIRCALARVDRIEEALVGALGEKSPQSLGELVRAAFRRVLNRDEPAAPNYAAVTVNAFLIHLARLGRIGETPDLLWERK